MSAHHGYQPRHHPAADRVDLDAVMERTAETRRWIWRQKEAIPSPVVEHLNHDVPDLVAELGAARERIDDYENAISWGTSWTSCARILDASITDHDRAEKAEAELRAAHEARDRLVAFHDAYDANSDRWVVRGRLFSILADWDQATGQPATADQPPGVG